MMVEMKMKFDVYRVPFSCYPRVQHAIKHLSYLSDRFYRLSNECPLVKCSAQTGNTTCNITEFFVCIQISETGIPLVIKDVLKRNEKCDELGIKQIDEVKDIIMIHDETYFVLVLNENENEVLISQSDRVKTIFVTDNITQENTASERFNLPQNQNVFIKSKISDIMEENMYEAFRMKIKCEQLCGVLENITIQENMKYFRSSKPKGKLARSKSLLKECGHLNKETEPAKRCKSAHERCKTEALVLESDELDLLTSTDFISKLEFATAIQLCTALQEYDMLNVEENHSLAEQLERIGRLYDEMTGMFCRSHVTKDKQPQTNKVSYGTVSNELKKKLKQLSTHIRGCGYRCRSFHVFVDDTFDGSNLKPAIEKILKDHNCLSPVVINSLSIKQFSTCKVGSKITAEFDNKYIQSGTLGGFAHSDEVDQPLCLVSRHVVTNCEGKPASNLMISRGNRTATVCVDESFRDCKDNVLDIAAAKLKSSNISIDVNYKTSEEKPATGKLTDYSREEMQGLHVQVCGSTTPTGFGTITMPIIEGVRDKEMDSYILIEDRENHQGKKPFCAEGDSGAIVCADDQDDPDKVQLISMVMGENLRKPGTYHTLDLKDGIQQVEDEIKSKIELL